MINLIVRNLRNKYIRRFTLCCIDCLIIAFSFSFSLLLTQNSLSRDELFNNIIFLAISGTFIYFISGQYQPITKYALNSGLYKLFVRNIIITIFFRIKLFIFSNDFPNLNFYFVFIINLTLTTLIVRLILRDIILLTNNFKKKELKPIGIYGAGSAGIQLCSSLKYSNSFRVKFFIDDSSNLQNRIIDDKPIYPSSKLKNLKNDVDFIFLAIPSLPLERKVEIIKFIKSQELNIQIVPPLEEVTSGRSKIGSLRNLEINDLLGRDPVIPNKKLLTGDIKGKNICITGAGGSIGKELCRSIFNLNPSKIILIENNELSLYSINEELKEFSKTSKILIFPYLLNLLDIKGLEAIFKEHTIDSIFHAAAYKHVPLVESNPISSIKNNILSTINICSIALNYNVSSIVQISSDKAVRPTNLMGATKRICELIFINYQKKIKNNNIRFSIVRFGNVLGSSGSVIPLFSKQIKRGGPITITHPDIIRYFMTKEEAAGLVIQSASLSKGGDIFLLDMGVPKKIIDLAREMIWLNGLKEKTEENPNGDIEIIYTGLRPGEKLYEEMLIESNPEKTIHPRIFKSKENQEYNFNLKEKLNKLIKNIEDNDERKSIKTISEIVFDWKLSNEIKKLL